MMPNDDYILRRDALNEFHEWIVSNDGNIFSLADALEAIPAADVVEEESILKFYYVRSIDEYWIGRRVDNFYYAEYDSKTRQWVWTHSRYLPWGEHIISTKSLWKEHIYPSKPEEIPFADWLQGFIRKYITADVEPVVRCKDCKHRDPEDLKCDCGELERAGCIFSVSDNYFCAHGEKKEKM